MDLAGILPLLEPFIVTGVLAIARTGGLLLALPHTSSAAVPMRIRATVMVALSLSMIGLAGSPVLALPGLVGIIVAVLGEVVVGLALGFVVHLALAGIRMAGELIGVEIGLSFSAVADPANPGASTATAALLGHMGMQLFFALGLDRMLVMGLARSVQRIPLGSATVSGATVAELTAQSSSAFVVALHLALPVLAASLAVKLALAVLARFVPRLQVFSLAFAITLATGLVALQQSLPGLGRAMAAQIGDMVLAFDRTIASLGH
jgi:flagellar biosynthetic protein FliR